jgi:hypothetical protein
VLTVPPPQNEPSWYWQGDSGTFEPPEWGFSDDFRFGRWYGWNFEFSPTQGIIVRYLFDHWRRGYLKVNKHELIRKARARSRDPYDLLRRNPAFRRLIICDRNGFYYLNLPGPDGQLPRPDLLD